MFYSAFTTCFYPSEFRPDYERAGTWPTDAVEVTDEEYATYGQGSPPEGMQRGGDANGHPTWVEIPPLPIGEFAESKRRSMDSARDATFAAGLPYDIAGTPGVVQTRPQDQINLLGLAAKARRLIDAGDTTTLMPLRGLSNATYMLTAQQMDALALAALTHIEGIYQRSWDRKDSIIAALKADDRAAIEAVVW